MQTVLMFSGQGTQYFQMGRELFDRNPTFHQWMVRLDSIARELTGTSPLQTLYGVGQKTDVFDRTAATHPAIFMVQYSLAQCVMEAGIMPDMVLGASLGSFAAATVAGSMEVDDAFRAVIEQATALEACSERGGMVAILADPALFAEDFLCKRSELAGVNFSSHFVISARQAEIPVIEAELRRRSVTFQRLPVSFAFHSPWIDAARAPFAAAMRSIRRTRLRLPFVCCEQASIVSDLPDDYFWRAVRRPIRFQEVAARLERNGAHRYIDVGASGTLATFLKYALPASSTSTVHAILTPHGRDQANLAALLASRGTGAQRSNRDFR